METTDRIVEVYKALGRILSNPPAYGLDERAPKPLVDELTASRGKLRDELIELKRYSEEHEDLLEAELSQDADCRKTPILNNAKHTAVVD